MLYIGLLRHSPPRLHTQHQTITQKAELRIGQDFRKNVRTVVFGRYKDESQDL